MKSITTCPSCQTQFLVSDEQLSQYSGKVRCGHCLTVFNAVDHITVPIETQTQPQEVVPSEVPNTDTTEVQPVEQNLDEIKATFTETTPEVTTAEVEEVIFTTPEAQALATPAIDTPIQVSTDADNIINASNTISDVESLVIEKDLKEQDTQEILEALFTQANLPLEEISNTLPDRETHLAENISSPDHTIDIDSGTLQEEISQINTFDYKPEYQYYLEQREKTSPVLYTLTGLLILLGVLQCLFFYRHTIATEFPETKPYLVNSCQFLGCKINLPKEIHLFSIDDSTIEEDPNYEGVIRLSSTITNRADFNQAFPNLEVTLTDTQDKPKLRRIFRPVEYLTKDYSLEEGIAAGDAISINMPLMADDLKPAGFRLLVSY